MRTLCLSACVFLCLAVDFIIFLLFMALDKSSGTHQEALLGKRAARKKAHRLPKIRRQSANPTEKQRRSEEYAGNGVATTQSDRQGK